MWTRAEGYQFGFQMITKKYIHFLKRFSCNSHSPTVKESFCPSCRLYIKMDNMIYVYVYLYRAFLILMTTQSAFTLQFIAIHPFTHTLKQCIYGQHFQGQYLAQGHSGKQMGEDWDRTSDQWNQKCLDRCLVSGCSIAHKSCLLHVGRSNMGQTKMSIYTSFLDRRRTWRHVVHLSIKSMFHPSDCILVSSTAAHLIKLGRCIVEEVQCRPWSVSVWGALEEASNITPNWMWRKRWN